LKIRKLSPVLKAIYAKARPDDHAVSRGTIDQMLGWEDKPAS
jgi:hypothetical protein